MKIYLGVMVTLGALLMLVLLVEMIIITARFLKKRMLEEQHRQYREFREAVDFEDPMKLELFLVRYAKSIYEEHARFELGEKYFRNKRFRLAQNTFQKLLWLYPESIHAQTIKQRLAEIEPYLKKHPEVTPPLFVESRGGEPFLE